MLSWRAWPIDDFTDEESDVRIMLARLFPRLPTVSPLQLFSPDKLEFLARRRVASFVADGWWPSGTSSDWIIVADEVI